MNLDLVSLNLNFMLVETRTLYRFCRSARLSDSSSFFVYCLLRDMLVSLSVCLYYMI